MITKHFSISKTTTSEKLMNLAIIFIILSILFPFILNQCFAQSYVIVKKDHNNKSIKRNISSTSNYSQYEIKNSRSIIADKIVEVGATYSQNTYNDMIDSPIGSAFSLSAGAILQANDYLSFTTSLIGTKGNIDLYEKIDDSQGEYITPGNIECDIFEFGISQKVAININPFHKFIVSPFIEGIALKGNIKSSYSFQDTDGAYMQKMNMNYYRLGGSVGLQFTFAENFSPFIKYSISSVRSSDDAEYTTSKPTDIIIHGEENNDYDSSVSTISAGINLLF